MKLLLVTLMLCMGCNTIDTDLANPSESQQKLSSWETSSSSVTSEYRHCMDGIDNDNDSDVDCLDEECARFENCHACGEHSSCDANNDNIDDEECYNMCG